MTSGAIVGISILAELHHQYVRICRLAMCDKCISREGIRIECLPNGE